MRLLSATEVKSAVQKEEEILTAKVNDLKREATIEIKRLNDLRIGIEQAKTCLTEELAQVKKGADTEKEVILGEIRVLEARRTAVAESLEEKRWQERHSKIAVKEIEVNALAVSLKEQEETLVARAEELDSRENGLDERTKGLDEKQRFISMMTEANNVVLDSLERQTKEMQKESALLDAQRASLKGAFDEAKHDLLTNSAYKK